MAYELLIDHGRLLEWKAFACPDKCCLVGRDTELRPPKANEEAGSVMHVRPMFQVAELPEGREFHSSGRDYDQLADWLEFHGDRPPIFL